MFIHGNLPSFTALGITVVFEEFETKIFKSTVYWMMLPCTIVECIFQV